MKDDERCSRCLPAPDRSELQTQPGLSERCIPDLSRGWGLEGGDGETCLTSYLVKKQQRQVWCELAKSSRDKSGASYLVKSSRDKPVESCFQKAANQSPVHLPGRGRARGPTRPHRPSQAPTKSTVRCNWRQWWGGQDLLGPLEVGFLENSSSRAHVLKFKHLNDEESIFHCRHPCSER